MKTNFFDANDHLSEEAVALYVDALKLNQLRKLPYDLRDHVSECVSCRISVEQLFSLLEEEKYDQETVHPFFSSRRGLLGKEISYYYKLAAMVLVAVGIVAACYYFIVRQESGPQVPNVTAVGSLKPPVDQHSPEVQKHSELLAENYSPYPNLEDMVNVHFRSGNLQITSPLEDQTAGKNILFAWRGGSAGKVELKIIDNKGGEAFSVSTEIDNYRFSGTLKPGLYYWKLESNDELLHVGKFAVR
jgi:hypothetical protein